jgi:hypothetical protein
VWQKRRRKSTKIEKVQPSVRILSFRFPRLKLVKLTKHVYSLIQVAWIIFLQNLQSTNFVLALHKESLPNL